MKKSLKIILIGLVSVLGFILLDTLQARTFKTCPLISWKEEQEDKDSWVKKGILIDTYYCTKDEDIVTVSWHFKTSKFSCPIDNQLEENNNEYSFFGKVVESHSSYIVVEIDRDEEKIKSSDKVRIELGEHNDALYEVGENLKITYANSIKDGKLARGDIIKIEIKSLDNFEFVFHQEPGNVKRQIIDKNSSNQYNYNVYIYKGKVDIIIDNETYSLEEALKEQKITMDEIIIKANKDFPNAISYDDGGSIEYHYDDYTIIKFHTIDGNRDVYIGNTNLKLNDVNK